MIQALLVRSDGSGGLATGMTYDPESETLVIVGTTYAKDFWGIQQENLEDKGECFVAVGDLKILENPEFIRSTFPRPAYCFGSIEISNDLMVNEKGNSDHAVSYYGVYLDGETSSPEGFLDTMQYTTRFIESSSFDSPYTVPAGLLPVTVTSSKFDPESVYLGLHNPRESFGSGGGGAEASEILAGLLSDWWSSTSPLQMRHALDSTFTPAPMVPQLRKIDVVTGELLYAITLETYDESATAMISEILFSPVTSSAETRMPPLIVVGSTNSANSVDSLFGTSDSALTSGKGDFDGYIFFLEADGSGPSTDPGTGKWAWRVASTGDNDDFIEGACLSPDQQFLFVVGSTEGIIEGIHSGGAFVIKYDLSIGEMVWQYQVTGDQVQGLLCTADDDAVYLGGVTESDLWESPGKLSSSQSPDAFVAKIIDGTAQWIRPLDTTLEEQGELRREWITGMEMTNQGNILVLLNSINLESGASDVFLVDLDPEKGDNDLYGAVNYAGEGIDTFNSLSKRSRAENEVNIAAIVIPLILGLSVFGMTCWWQYRRKNARIPKSQLDQHLEIEVTRDEDMTNHDGGSELL